jgi:hypothetical protein
MGKSESFLEANIVMKEFSTMHFLGWVGIIGIAIMLTGALIIIF